MISLRLVSHIIFGCNHALEMIKTISEQTDSKLIIAQWGRGTSHYILNTPSLERAHVHYIGTSFFQAQKLPELTVEPRLLQILCT